MANQNQGDQGNQGNQGAQNQGNQGQTQSNPVKDPDDWTTGGEPITGPQESYLQTLAQQAGEDIDTSNMTKSEASEHINRLQAATGREGQPTGQPTGTADGDDVQQNQAGN